jgi:hypothetical protein
MMMMLMIKLTSCCGTNTLKSFEILMACGVLEFSHHPFCACDSQWILILRADTRLPCNAAVGESTEEPPLQFATASVQQDALLLENCMYARNGLPYCAMGVSATLVWSSKFTPMVVNQALKERKTCGLGLALMFDFGLPGGAAFQLFNMDCYWMTDSVLAKVGNSRT